jgi:ubiquinone/menaquinone biosynthesis C-methylase UbiE
MTEKILSFYESLADCYHLIFEDWGASIERQARILEPLLASRISGQPMKILDCACGIGTQALGLAALGHPVTASDVSHSAVNRAQKEAQLRSLQLSFFVSDMTSLDEVPGSDFDVVIVMDNALPHLNADQLRLAAAAMASKLKPGGILMASIRDYDQLVLDRPSVQPPAFYGAGSARRIVHQVWDWVAESEYELHLFITVHSAKGWEAHHFVSGYRCLLRDELTRVLRDAGFQQVEWLMPSESGFYQPIVVAKLSA